MALRIVDRLKREEVDPRLEQWVRQLTEADRRAIQQILEEIELEKGKTT